GGRDIERRLQHEIDVGNIMSAWVPSCQDADTCVACDSRYYCPRPAGRGEGHVIEVPPVP
ncbi:MAG TPA: hypothetical protein PLB41_16815, partial [Rubrivivax sp.]|nr:hypothetical protein [Rubrivivax sp.]